MIFPRFFEWGLIKFIDYSISHRYEIFSWNAFNGWHCLSWAWWTPRCRWKRIYQLLWARLCVLVSVHVELIVYVILNTWGRNHCCVKASRWSLKTIHFLHDQLPWSSSSYQIMSLFIITTIFNQDVSVAKGGYICLAERYGCHWSRRRYRLDAKGLTINQDRLGGQRYSRCAIQKNKIFYFKNFIDTHSAFHQTFSCFDVLYDITMISQRI